MYSVRTTNDDESVTKVSVGQSTKDEAKEDGRDLVVFTRRDGTSDELLPLLETFLSYWCNTHA